MSEKMKKIVRHSLSVRFEHWLIAATTFLLVISAAARITVLHYFAAVILVLAAGFHIINHLVHKEFALIPQKGDLSRSYRTVKAVLSGRVGCPR